MSVLTKAELCRLVPHEGTMCLLDSIERWDDAHITCLARSHQDSTNPLRRMDRLEAICGLEYAGQAMAVHVGLLNHMQTVRALVGYLGAVRELAVHVERLDVLGADLAIEATRVLADGTSFIYSFQITAASRAVMTGRASIFLKSLEP